MGNNTEKDSNVVENEPMEEKVGEMEIEEEEEEEEEEEVEEKADSDEAYYIVCELEGKRFGLTFEKGGVNGSGVLAEILAEGNMNQMFHRIEVMGDYYCLVNVHSSKKAILPKGDPGEGNEYHSWEYDRWNQHQLFDLENTVDGYTKIISKKGELVVELAEGGKILQMKEHGGANQKWKFIPAGNKYKRPVNDNPLSNPQVRPAPINLKNGEEYYLICEKTEDDEEGGKTQNMYAIEELENDGGFEGREHVNGKQGQVFVAKHVIDDESAMEYWIFVNRSSQKAIDMAGDSTIGRQFVSREFSHHNENQYFIVKRPTEGEEVYNITCSNGGLALELTSERKIQQNEVNNGSGQRWKFVPFRD